MKQSKASERRAREELCDRVGGVFGGWNCYGGICEGCGRQFTDQWCGLRVHEIKFRSRGGEVSLENSLMYCSHCHDKAHGK